jgi:nitrite reductase/ring-hydroxylating ferredoxin subunit
MNRMTRRGWLQTGALLAGAPCACLAEASHDCCTLPEAPADAIRFEPDLLTIDLGRTPELSRTGSAIKVVEPGRQVQMVIARPAKDQFVALDQKCTHGGGALTYVHKHKHLYCTCWGHSKFALDGSVIRWPNQQTPRPVRAYPVKREGNLLRITVEGLA